MIVTVTTLKDRLPNVQRFVRGNLASGVDHMFVCLDAEQPDVAAWLREQPEVTCIEAYGDWWAGKRPPGLNPRQVQNANVVKALLTTVDWCDWIFHVDADEVARVDHAALAKVPEGTRVVRLSPLEAVSRKHWDAPPTWFKRKLGKDDLTLLHLLGVIEEPHNRAYFHGHLIGKVGIRPDLELGLTLHRVLGLDKAEVPSWTTDGLEVLHYESVDGEEFVRKWTAMLTAGPSAGFRANREPTAVALRTLIQKDLTEEQARPYLMRLFERTTEDDFETLRELGMLVEVDPLAGGHTPEPLPPGARRHVDDMLAGLHARPKAPFRPGQPVADVQRVLDEVAAASEGPLTAARRFLRRS